MKHIFTPAILLCIGTLAASLALGRPYYTDTQGYTCVGCLSHLDEDRYHIGWPGISLRVWRTTSMTPSAILSDLYTNAHRHQWACTALVQAGMWTVQPGFSVENESVFLYNAHPPFREAVWTAIRSGKHTRESMTRLLEDPAGKEAASLRASVCRQTKCPGFLDDLIKIVSDATQPDLQASGP